jgi:ribosomal protein S18 acetylase RimI-like enzyme
MSKLFRSDTSDVDELVEFSERNPWKPHYPSPLVRKFLTELISSKDLIFDFHDENGRVAAAVLLDKVNNPANDACLEILGLRADADSSDLLTRFILLAKECTPVNRSGFQVGLSNEFSIDESFLNRQGLRHYYHTFEMRRSDLKGLSIMPLVEIQQALPEDVDQIYSVLCESFAQSPDTSIPVADTWKSGFLKSTQSHFYVLRSRRMIVGFANLVEGEDGKETEIRTLGVLPTSRGQGIGQQLLHYCLGETARLKFNSCRLTVSVTNQKALGLYLKAGFTTIEKHRCYRMSIVRC